MNKNEFLFTLKISSILATRMFGLFMIFPVFSVYAVQYDNSTPYLIGLAIGIYGLTQALLQIPFGYLSDQFGRKPIIIIGLILFFIGSVIAANANDIIGIIIGRAIQGSGAISAVLMAFLADFIPYDKRIKANAFIGIQIGMAFILSILIAPLITVNLGIDGLFWVIAILSVFALIIVTTMPYVKPSSQYNLSLNNIKQILTIKLFKLNLSVLFLHLIITCIFIVIPLLLVENKIVAANLAGNWKVYLPVMITSFLIMMPIIIFAEKYQKTKIILLILIAVIAIVQLLFYFLQIQNKLIYETFFILLTAFFVGFNIIEAMLPSLVAKAVAINKKGLAMGLFSTSQFLGTFIGGSLGGLIYNIFNLNSVLLFTVLVAIIWFVVMLVLNKLDY
jgi:MFS family permease